MNQTDKETSANQLSQQTIVYLNNKLTKKCKLLLTMLYKYQSIKHKELAEILDIKTNGLSNLISKINKIQKEFIKSESKGRCKFYSLSPLAEEYTENVLLPVAAARESSHISFLCNDYLTDVLDSLKRFQEFEGEDWYIVLDDLLFVETKNNFSFKEEIHQIHMDYKEETYQNYANLKNALITLNVQHGKQAAQKIYGIIDQKILSHRLDSLLSNVLDDFYKMEPLFQLEKENLQTAYSIIDRIFEECFPETFGVNSVVHSKPLEAKYNSIYSVIINMRNEFKKNNYSKAVSIEQWEKKFHTKEHFSCLSYIAEKCSTIYIKESQ